MCTHKDTTAHSLLRPALTVFLRLRRGIDVEGGVGPNETDGARAGAGAGP